MCFPSRPHTARAAGVADRERDAKVSDQWLAILKENVLGLQVAMDHTVAVRIVERSGDRDRQPHGFIDRELLLTVEPGPQRFALHERHHIEEQSTGRAAVEQR
jgi:hypothetical protein